jgi:hypothetical protein
VFFAWVFRLPPEEVEIREIRKMRPARKLPAIGRENRSYQGLLAKVVFLSTTHQVESLMSRLILCKTRLLLLTSIICLTFATLAFSDAIFTWEASSGLTPDEIDPPFALVVAGGASEPTLNSGILTISTAQNAQNVAYQQMEPMIDTDAKFTFEWQLRVVSGSSSSNARGPVGIWFTLGGSYGTLLIIDIDRVFFNDGPLTPGQVATVDTDEAMHTYRLEHDGQGNFTLFYDDAELLMASAYFSVSDHGNIKRIGWGEGSTLAFGVSEWVSLSHNAINPFFKDSFEDIK